MRTNSAVLNGVLILDYTKKKYIKKGLVKPSYVNLRIRQFHQNTDFYFWQWSVEDKNIQHDCNLEKKQLFDSFVNEYQDFSKWLTRKKFSQWLLEYAKFMDLPAPRETRSGESRCIYFVDKENDFDDTPF